MQSSAMNADVDTAPIHPRAADALLKMMKNIEDYVPADYVKDKDWQRDNWGVQAEGTTRGLKRKRDDADRLTEECHAEWKAGVEALEELVQQLQRELGAKYHELMTPAVSCDILD